MMSDPEVEAGKYPRLASGQREIGRKVKGKEYLISAPGQRERISHKMGRGGGFFAVVGDTETCKD